MSQNNKSLFEDGLKIRREVLGDEYVDRALANADAFSMPIQELVTEYCWGSIWSRPGLDRKTRSLLNIAMLTALNRPHEVKIHLNGAVNNGCTADEIREVIMQAIIYCGVPAGIDTLNIAREILADQIASEAKDKPQ